MGERDHKSDRESARRKTRYRNEIAVRVVGLGAGVELEPLVLLWSEELFAAAIDGEAEYREPV